MQAASAEFDALLGGVEELPRSINLLQFSAARQTEIEVIQRMLDEPSGVKMAFQRLPKHMRRRVMSHNVKRLPRRLRDIHLSQQQKSGVPPHQKRPSRKFRRRPRNLCEEYARRQSRVQWLETHVWHAKRFHVVERWCCKIPDRPCDKAFRACYRASAKHCLVQDVSYYGCVQVQGASEVLVRGLRTLCDPCQGLSIGAMAYLKGTRAGEVFLYEDGTLKRGIGNVMFNWKPPSCDVNGVLWIWAHPAFYEQVLCALQDNFKDSVGAVTVRELKHKLCRFRLTGPLSQSVLRSALKPASFVNGSVWFRDFLNTQRNVCLEQNEFWQSAERCDSPGQFSPNSVLCLNVEDPRFNFPKKRTKAVCDFVQGAASAVKEVPLCASSGAIWDESCREQCLKDKLSCAELCNLRSKQLVPGTDIERDAPVVPVMLIQRPGTCTNNLGKC